MSRKTNNFRFPIVFLLHLDGKLQLSLKCFTNINSYTSQSIKYPYKKVGRCVMFQPEQMFLPIFSSLLSVAEESKLGRIRIQGFLGATDFFLWYKCVHIKLYFFNFLVCHKPQSFITFRFKTSWWSCCEATIQISQKLSQGQNDTVRHWVKLHFGNSIN